MFNTLKLHQLASACRDSVIGIQSDQLDIFKKVAGAEKQVEFFNDELVKHDENWTKVIGRMRKVWKNMKSEFAVTRKAVQVLHKRVGLIEKNGGYEYTSNDIEEQADDFSQLVGKTRGLEKTLNDLVNIVHSHLHKKGPKLSKGGLNPDRMEELYRSIEERVNGLSTRVGALERREKELHLEHFANGTKALRRGGWE